MMRTGRASGGSGGSVVVVVVGGSVVVGALIGVVAATTGRVVTTAATVVDVDDELLAGIVDTTGVERLERRSVDVDRGGSNRGFVGLPVLAERGGHDRQRDHGDRRRRQSAGDEGRAPARSRDAAGSARSINRYEISAIANVSANCTTTSCQPSSPVRCSSAIT